MGQGQVSRWRRRKTQTEILKSILSFLKIGYYYEIPDAFKKYNDDYLKYKNFKDRHEGKYIGKIRKIKHVDEVTSSCKGVLYFNKRFVGKTVKVIEQ